MKKALLISCFEEWYRDRLEPICGILKEHGYEIRCVHADYNHIGKKYSKRNEDICDYIHVPAYRSNISLQRIRSHLVFGKKVNELINGYKPDLIYLILPPNNTARYCVKYKSSNPNTKLIIDIIDLWPESMPLGIIKKTLPSIIWRKWRNDAIKVADHVFTECNLYQEKLNYVIDGAKASTLYLFKEQTEELDENGKIMYKEFYQNNNFSNSNENNKENNNVIDVSKNILSQMQENSEITNSHMINNSGMNFNANIIGNNISNNKNKNLENKDMNIQKKINNNIEENDIMNENNLDNNDEQNLPQPEPLLIKGNAPIKNANNFFRTQNIMSQQDLNINDISSIKSGVNFSTNLHMNTNNSNYFINETNIQPSKYPENYRNKKNMNRYKDPYEMNELQQKRYKKALRKLVLDRFNSKKIDIPSICSCGQLQRKIDSLLNENKLITQNDLMNVDCANNCIYYQKPGSYHRALTDIIQSIRTLQLENGIRK